MSKACFGEALNCDSGLIFWHGRGDDRGALYCWSPHPLATQSQLDAVATELRTRNISGSKVDTTWATGLDGVATSCLQITDHQCAMTGGSPAATRPHPKQSAPGRGCAHLLLLAMGTGLCGAGLAALLLF